MNEFDPYGLTPEEKAQYDAAGTNLLVVPSSARRRKDEAYWAERAVIKELKVEEPGVKTPAQPGDATFALVLQMQVTPDSQQQGDPSPNIGRTIFAWFRFNVAEYRRQQGKGKKLEAQAMMSDMSFGAVKSLMLALDLDPELGMQPFTLPSQHAEDILGQKVWVSIRQKPDEQRGRQDEVQRFLQEEPNG